MRLGQRKKKFTEKYLNLLLDEFRGTVNVRLGRLERLNGYSGSVDNRLMECWHQRVVVYAPSYQYSSSTPSPKKVEDPVVQYSYCKICGKDLIDNV